jgi:hypothetical protein
VKKRRDNNRQRILAAACELPAEGFSGPELVMAAWRKWPGAFSLPGTLGTHPHSNAVLSKLVGKGGLCALGMIGRIAPGRYVVTDVGRQAAAAP